MKELKEKISRFQPVEIRYDESLLDENQKMVVQKLFEASKIIDQLFLEQVYSKNLEIKTNLENGNSELQKLQLEYFNIMFGPFDRLDHDAPFYSDTPKPAGANFYPEDMTKDEFNSWLEEHPEDQEAFTSEFTVIRRDNEKLTAIPYNRFYNEKLVKIKELLEEAAEYAENPSLKKYLLSRAEALLSNDYFQSDMDWMDLKDHTIEVVIGPYEVYEDGMFNYKASFESFITLVDPLESEKVQIFSRYLNDMEKNLPIPDEHKNFNRGSESPIMVVQEVFRAGDSKAGVQTIAFNLPNDERVRKAKGSKKVMIKNFHEAKFEKLLKPIAIEVLEESQLKFVTFDAFFNHTLMHEISHGLGPGFITINGTKTEVKKELKETYSMMEECKADILGLFNNIFMIDKGVYDKSFEKELWTTFLAGIFRSVRFGIAEAHGGGNAIIFNYMLENGGFIYDEAAGKLKVNYDNVNTVLSKLANKVLMLQATGDYNGALELKTIYGVNSPVMKSMIAKLSGLPVDIKPEFQIEK